MPIWNATARAFSGMPQRPRVKSGLPSSSTPVGSPVATEP